MKKPYNSIKRKIYYLKNRDKILKDRKEYYAKNVIKCKFLSKKYYAKNTMKCKFLAIFKRLYYRL